MTRAAAAASADQAEAEANRAGMMNPPGSHSQYAPWGQQGVGSPQPWGSPSPGYADGDAHGGFNPNVTFPHGYPPSARPLPPSPACSTLHTTTRRRPTLPPRRPRYAVARCPSHLGDTDETEADMDDIIVAGSAAAAASPVFVT